MAGPPQFCDLLRPPKLLDTDWSVAAMNLIEECFPKDDDDTIRKCIWEACDPGSEPEFMAEHKCDSIKYWFVGADGEMVGIAGLYHNTGEQDTIWVSWFCVSESARRLGVGTHLLKHVITVARQHGYEYLRLFTGFEDLSAHRLYRRFGFYETHRDLHNDEAVIYMRLDLSKPIRIKNAFIYPDWIVVP